MRNLVISAITIAAIAFIAYYVYDYYKLPDSPEGNKITELVYPDVNGQPLALSSLKGNIVLVDFWAGWCGPCRYENRQLIILYNQYHSAKFSDATGFDIYGISLDVNRDYWMRAIEQDGLPWKNQVSTLQGWQSEPAITFGVRSIPANILIDENGKILGRNLEPNQVEKILEKRIEK